MLNKKVKSLLFIFIILFCVAAVNAESIDTNVESIDEINMDSQSVDIINVESDDYVATIAEEESDFGNLTEFKELIDNATSGEVKLEKDYKYVYDENHTDARGVNIDNKTIIIDGNGHTIDGSHLTRLFILNDGASLTLKNLNIINCDEFGWGNGGVIYSRSDNDVNVTIINSTFRNNAASAGGVIYTGLGQVTIINSTFINNTVFYEGGVVYSDNVNVSNSVFINNTGEHGGAIRSGNAIIDNSTFINNTAYYGGAVSCDNLTLSNSTFTDNNALIMGGAVYTNEANIVESTFIGNNATQGGAIVSMGNTTINKSKFADNTAEQGGAIYYTTLYLYFFDAYQELDPELSIEEIKKLLDGMEEYNDVSLTVTDSTFEDNNGEFGDDIYTRHNTTVSGNNYTKDSYANIYANDTIIKTSIVSVLQNNTYYVIYGGKYTLNATVLADGASVDGYDVVITDGETQYNTKYVGNGVYTVEGDFIANFTNKTFSAFINNTNSTDYEVENGTIISFVVNLKVENLTKYYGNDSKFVVVLTDSLGKPIANQTITITINGVDYTRTTDENGTILMNINLAPGVYETYVTYETLTENATITVLSTIVSEDLIKYFKNGTQYYATFYNIDGTPLANTNVTFNINGVFYTRETDENGTAKLNINLNPGEYIITAINPVNNEMKANNVTVLSTITAQDVVKYFRNGTQYSAIFTDLDGTPLANTEVTFNIHGVFYTRTTDENGVATLNINLNPGEYIITAVNPVNNETYSNSITVLNVIESEDLVMYASDRKPFTVTILGDHGAPLANAEVTFNIHGVFYHKTTDANGQVNLDINLIPGNYIITTYYNGLSVSNTIVVQ